MKSEFNPSQILEDSSIIDKYKSTIEQQNAKISDLEENLSSLYLEKSQLVANLEEIFNENRELKSTIEILQSTIENSSSIENVSKSGNKANKFTDNFKFINAGIIYLQKNRYLEGLFTLVAIASTLTLAISDFSNVDQDGNLLTANSIRNTIVKESDFYFVIIFIFEAVLKISALGLYSSKG
jgi:regulator of replication initiation timing